MVKKIKQISARGHHTVALTTTNEVYIWGYNTGGQLGDGTKINRHEPLKVNIDNKKVKYINTGSQHTIAITEDGFIYTWGLNDKGQIGDGTTEDRYTPTIIMIKR